MGNMFGCGAEITLWRREKDKYTKKELFRRYDVPVKCRWRKQCGRNISGTGAVKSDNAVVIVPYYSELDTNLICPGDIIALGRHYALDIAEANAKAGEFITVSKVAYNFDSEDFNKTRGRHLRIEGK